MLFSSGWFREASLLAESEGNSALRKACLPIYRSILCFLWKPLPYRFCLASWLGSASVVRYGYILLICVVKASSSFCRHISLSFFDIFTLTGCSLELSLSYSASPSGARINDLGLYFGKDSSRLRLRSIVLSCTVLGFLADSLVSVHACFFCSFSNLKKSLLIRSWLPRNLLS
jgi:hypothetical protein